MYIVDIKEWDWIFPILFLLRVNEQNFPAIEVEIILLIKNTFS